MPEVPLCRYCRRPVDLDEEKYVIPNKDQVYGDKEKYEYAHVECQRKATP